MRRRRSSSLLRSIALLATTTLLLFGRTTNVENNRPSSSLPWPCLFASASSITHRITSNYHQAKINAATLRFQRDVIRPSEERRALYNYNNNGADDQYVNQGAQNYAQGDDAAYADAQKAMQDKDDDVYSGVAVVNLDDVDFDEVNIMPVSCVNYHNGHMIKFQFFEKSNYNNCHFKNIGTFVVSIAHYMRAYFNYQALTEGTDFKLPADASYLNCVKLAESSNLNYPLYAKIGCQHRDTYTSTKLQLILYEDAQCSQPFENSEDMKVKDGYYVGDYFMSNKVSFRPPFYNCQSCHPDAVSATFSKSATAWYDDDHISEFGTKYDNEDEGGNDDGNQYANHDDANGYYVKADDYTLDDQYTAQDDANGGNYVAQDDVVQYNYQQHDDAFYQMDDANRRLRKVMAKKATVDASQSLTAKLMRKELQAEFDQGLDSIKRKLDAEVDEADENYDADDVASSWNICQRVYHYGGTCQDDCLKLDAFRIDEWSQSDIFLLVIMIVFMGAMMLLVFAKRVKAYERAAMWGDEPGAPSPGLPPCAILMLFGIVFTIIVVLAALKFVNETLVFAVVTCVLLFVYMLKLTLFESRKQVFLPARSTRKMNPSLRHELI